ncbi:mitochondrial carrier protein Leu5p [Trichomonascus vanleenenianus]|uniref:coenzyme A transporter n=1 Tax=Trichomonascus vanleenenianus TaxID=2268995 RepID=UPI003EC9D5C4
MSDHKATGDALITSDQYHEHVAEPSASPDLTSTRQSRREAVRTDKQNIEYVVKSAIAGGLAGSAAKTLIAPLDRVKILFQTSNPSFRKYTGSWLGFYRAGRHIYAHDGFLALFQGHSATLLRIFPYAAIKFVTYEQIRAILIRKKEHETAGRRLLAGSLCGVASVFCVYPLDLVRVRLAFDTKKFHNPAHGIQPGKLLTTVKTIWSEPATFPALGRFSNYYRGFVPTVLGMVPYAGVSFWAHDMLQDMFRMPNFADSAVDFSRDTRDSSSHRRHPLKASYQLIAGGLSGVIAQTASYPLEVVRRHMQVSGVNGTVRQGMIATAKSVVASRGASGLFVGLTIGYIKVLPMFACSFFVYDRAKLFLGI